MVLDGARRRLRLPDPLDDYDNETQEPRLTARDSAFVLVHLGDTVANTAAEEDWCPACGERNAIRYLGTGAAATGRGVRSRSCSPAGSWTRNSTRTRR